MYIEVAKRLVSKTSFATTAAGVGLGVAVGSAEQAYEKKHNMTTGEKIGITVGTCAGFIIVGLAINYLCKYLANRKNEKNNQDIMKHNLYQSPPIIHQRTPQNPFNEYQSSLSESNEKLESFSSMEYNKPLASAPPPVYIGYQRAAARVP